MGKESDADSTSGMTAMTATAMNATVGVIEQAALRRAAGYVELGELLLVGEEATPAVSVTVLRRALAELAVLPESLRHQPLASFLEGEALRALGEWNAAIPALTRATAGGRRGGRLEAWMGLGWCWKRLDRLDDAIGALREGLTAFPEEPILHYNLACYHSLAGGVQAAIDHLTRAIEIDGRFRDLTGAERDFDAIRTDPRFVAAVHVTV
jgi:tetratricopeptide (TPR) repeat protein